MTESLVTSIRIIKEIPFDGGGDSLFNRLRNVKLRGFPDVQIYKDASFRTTKLTSDQIQTRLYTPQTRVYRNPNLNMIEHLANLFSEKGIDIFEFGKVK